jgi:hypothetical protein
LIRTAEEILAGRWEAFGVLRKDMTDPDWFFDPVTGMTAPSAPYCFGIDHRSETATGNVKQIWELSRMQHTTVAAGAFAVTGDERYAQLVARHLRSWWCRNPILSGINWTSGIEIAVRLISWVWIRRLLEGWAGAPELYERNPVAVEQIWWHQHYLASFRSRGSSANNHVIAEAAGQLVAALAFDWFDESPKWAAVASVVLERQLEANTFPSGVNREMAFEYHRFVAELGVVAAVEADRARRPLGTNTWTLLGRMMDAAAASVDAGLRPPRHGDGDDGRAVVLDSRHDQTWSGLLAIGAALFGAATWWPRFEPTVASALLRSLAGNHRLNDRPASRPDHFADAGLTLLRTATGTSPEIWCRCDHGPHGYLSIAAHAHADALSVEVRHGGADVLADPGTYCYHGEPEWRSYFRSTVAHNTVEVAGRDQSPSGGPFLWRSHPTTVLRELRFDERGTSVWSAEHDGYEVLDPPATHRRTVAFAGADRRIQIFDQLATTGRHLVRLAFHLGPDIAVDLDSARAELSWNHEGAVAKATLDLPVQLEWAAFRGAVDPILGWYSARFGQKQPATVLVGEAVTDGPATLESVLQFRI